MTVKFNKRFNLEGKALAILVDMLNILVYLPFLKVDEEDIESALKQLKKHEWFREYLIDERYRKLIIHDKDVRHLIGKFNPNKLASSNYHGKCQMKLNRVLENKLRNAA